MLGTIAMALMFLWFVLPVLAFAANLGTGTRLHPFVLYLLTVMVGFLLLVAGAWAADLHLKAEMDSFDLDGGIGGSELTPEAQRAIDDWANDTGRTMVIFTGIPMSAIWFGICFSFLYLGKWVITKVLAIGSTASRPGKTELKQGNSDNPFQSPTTE
jgi:hypothetical protein